MTTETPADQIVFICGECDCRTWLLRADARVECANCGNVACADCSGDDWVRNVPPPQEPKRDTAGTTNHITYSHAAFARASVLRKIDQMKKDDTLAFVVAYDVDTRGHHWLNVESKEQADNIAHQLEALAEYIRKTEF